MMIVIAIVVVVVIVIAIFLSFCFFPGDAKKIHFIENGNCHVMRPHTVESSNSLLIIFPDGLRKRLYVRYSIHPILFVSSSLD
jgi:hypothetical protein